MCSPAGYAFLVNNSAASGQPALNQATLKKMMIPMLDIETQQRISSVLNNINSKIALNNSICTDLEAMAKQIYDYWFVQFDFPDENGKPYKSSGGKMVWCEELNREIPEGWDKGIVLDLGQVVGGATPSTKDQQYYTEHGIAWATPKDLSDSSNVFFSHGERDITKEGLDSCSASLMPMGSVLMTSRAPIGYLAISSNEVCTNQGFKSVVPKENIGPYYIYYSLKSIMDYIKRYGAGSTFSEISKADVENLKICIPSQPVVDSFNNSVIPMFETIKNKENENKQLTNFRDFLLPMLMNGQIKIGA